MSDDEVLLMLVSAAVGAIAIWRWDIKLMLARQLNRMGLLFGGLLCAPLLALAGVFVALRLTSSFDVRDDPAYLFLYTALGVAWFMLAAFGMRYLNIFFGDDAVERRNYAAAIVIVAAMLAHAVIYAGANVGNGPGWWTVIVAGGLGSAGWFFFWGGAEQYCDMSERITVDRDLPAAFRLGAYGLAMGIICARGAAGDWTSFGQTLREFSTAWPVIPLTALVIGVERGGRASVPALGRSLSASFMIAAVYLAAAAMAVFLAGPPPRNPQYDSVRMPLPLDTRYGDKGVLFP